MQPVMEIIEPEPEELSMGQTFLKLITTKDCEKLYNSMKTKHHVRLINPRRVEPAFTAAELQNMTGREGHHGKFFVFFYYRSYTFIFRYFFCRVANLFNYSRRHIITER